MGRNSPTRQKVQQKQERARAARASLRSAQAQRRAGAPVEAPVDPAFLDDDEDGEDPDAASGTLGKMRSTMKSAAGADEAPEQRRRPLLGLVIVAVIVAAIIGFVLAR